MIKTALDDFCASNLSFLYSIVLWKIQKTQSQNVDSFNIYTLCYICLQFTQIERGGYDSCSFDIGL